MELRTNDFTPKVYYELYMEAFDQLDALERYFARLARTGTPMSTIYDMVQQTANVLARLYLMITAGSVYIKSGQIAAKDVLMDLLDLVKGVQHPQRGLFLRYYLIQMCKDKLPDIGTAYEGGFNQCCNLYIVYLKKAIGNLALLQEWAALSTMHSISSLLTLAK